MKYKIAKGESKWGPEVSEFNKYGGFYILKSLPNGVIKPAPFVEGSRSDLEKTISG